MKTRLRILLPLLLVCTALLAMALCASAATETGACGANLTYTLDTSAGTLTITGSGAMTDWSHVDKVPWHASRASVRSVVLPQGLTTVGARAFSGCSKLTSASIPAGVTRIGTSAFADCTALASVTMPAGMTEIGDLAFFACGMTGITLPTGLEKIGDAAFAACKKLTRLEIPAGVARIGDMTFSLCDSLADITLTEHLNTVGTGAFTYCQNLQSITLPAGVEVVEELAFYGYTNLKTVKVLNPQFGRGRDHPEERHDLRLRQLDGGKLCGGEGAEIHLPRRRAARAHLCGDLYSGRSGDLRRPRHRVPPLHLSRLHGEDRCARDSGGQKRA